MDAQTGTTAVYVESIQRRLARILQDVSGDAGACVAPIDFRFYWVKVGVAIGASRSRL